MEKDHWQWHLRSIGLSLGFQLLVLVRLYRRMARYEKRGQNSLIHAVTARMQLAKGTDCAGRENDRFVVHVRHRTGLRRTTGLNFFPSAHCEK